MRHEKVGGSTSLSLWRDVVRAILQAALLWFLCAIPMTSMMWLAFGEAVTAQVEGCAKEGTYNVCRGSWTFDDGRSYNGSIDGATGDDVGRTVEVWATDDLATTNRLAWAAPYALFGAILVALALALAVAVARSRRARARS
ncbi:hypothetical protein ACWDV4_12335 [Micromonospora sp. NPDC003197]